MIGLYFAIIVVVSYLIGNINFAKIVVRIGKKEDITKKGSGNPGTMNVVRNYGILMGALVLLLEAVKAGVPAIVSAVLMSEFGLYDLAFFVAGASVILGQVYPVIYKFKGGKGIACMAGLFFFTSYWWIAIIAFVLCALLLYIVDYAFLASLSFVTIMTVVMIVHLATVQSSYFYVAIILLSVIWLFAMFNHRSNFKRFFENRENKTGFRHKILMTFSKKYREWIKQEEVKEMQKKEAAKIFLEQQEQEKEQKKEEKEQRKEEEKKEKLLEKEEKKKRRETKKATQKAKKKTKKRAKKIKRKTKKVDKRVKKLKNGKRNPFRHHKKKKSSEDLT